MRSVPTDLSNGVADGAGHSTIPYVVDEHRMGEPRQLRIVCMGAGAAGLNLAHQVEKHMKGIDFCIYEKNAEVGGTWLENR
jgi:ribulose 1,5-bisphosphate synthetase/thiazole synthase